MDSTSQFFSKLRKLGRTLEAETARLQVEFENRNKEPDEDTTMRATRAHLQLNGEVKDLKVQIQDQLFRQRGNSSEIDRFIKACEAVEHTVTKEIQNIQSHLEKYGYEPPCRSPGPSKASCLDAKTKNQVSADDETSSAAAEDEEGDAEESPRHSPQETEQPITVGMRTPQLADFGLSEMQLKRVLAGAEWCSEVPPMPELSFPKPSLKMPVPPPLPVTPKCVLRMDDELQTPQMHTFGISEKTMFLNNDFTMDLYRKNAEKRDSGEVPSEVQNSVMESLGTQADDMKSLGLPSSPNQIIQTPEVPAFQTPYVKRLVSTKKSKPDTVQAEDDSNPLAHQITPCDGKTSTKRAWDYSVPDITPFGVANREMPEMPNLESDLGNSLQSKNGKIQKMSESENGFKATSVSGPETDGATQEFSLGTPRIRTTFQELSTPEMPDLSSVTQDICKLLTQAQKKKTIPAASNPHASTLRRKESLSPVSPSEFQTLPNYLRRMTLSNLNQAVSGINRFTEQHRGEINEYTMEELKNIIKVGTMAPVYILCLTELQRLELVDGLADKCVYKLVTHT